MRVVEMQRGGRVPPETIALWVVSASYFELQPQGIQRMTFGERQGLISITNIYYRREKA